MNKVQNNKAWWLVLPVFLLVAFSAVIPMMTVVNYSVQDIFDQSSRYFVGAEWYKQVLLDPRLHDSLLRQFIYSGDRKSVVSGKRVSVRGVLGGSRIIKKKKYNT